ncbi:borealin-2 [Columba guinea]|nr:borealin-2 [Columba guinea]
MAVSVRKAAGKRRSSDSGVGPERGTVCREKKEQRFALFLRDFDQQGLEGGEEVALAAVVADCSLEDIPNPKLVRTNSRKGKSGLKVTTIVQYEDAKHTPAKKMSKKVSKTKSLVSLASGFSGKTTPLSRSGLSSTATTDTMKSLASNCGATNFKTMAKVSKSAGLHPGVCRTEPGRGRVHGMVLRSKSAPQDKTVPFVNIPLADGQTLCTAGGDLHNIDVQLLRQDTIQRIHNLVEAKPKLVVVNWRDEQGGKNRCTQITWQSK